jgi:2-iminoacetate synthase
MRFSEILKEYSDERIRRMYARVTPRDVERALAHDERTLEDLVALLSPCAVPYLEAMAQEARRLTRKHFGRVIQLYVPLYLSNLCAADCVYCGYAARSGSHDKRLTLSPQELRRECEVLAQRGFEHVLLLTGEAPKIVTPRYIQQCIEIAHAYFHSVSVEVYAVTEADYRKWVEAGLDGVTLYMETYHRPTYEQVHLLGEKRDYERRLEAIAEAGRAGVRQLTVGALLGLFDWRLEMVRLALHVQYLEREFWQSSVSVSFPRLVHTPQRYSPPYPVSEAELVQIMVAMRLLFPYIGFNLSTRERPAFRDRLIPLGVTSMSAGSSTRPGGYAVYTEGTPTEKGTRRMVLEQFEIEDVRPVEEVVAAIRRAGYEPVWKDYDRAFDARAARASGEGPEQRAACAQ